MPQVNQHYLFRNIVGHWVVMRDRQLLAGREDMFEALSLLWHFIRLYQAPALPPSRWMHAEP
ncbi:hypothetical protein [Stenotrophomonas maltophilia]|uniref:hypothetical protein n=1 Tax=Stenotrophomonas maltophilia TaxID=40324 RepID=UPI0039C28CA6